MRRPAFDIEAANTAAAALCDSPIIDAVSVIGPELAQTMIAAERDDA